MKTKYVIVVYAAIILCVTTVLLLKLHSLTESEVVERFRATQHTTVKQLAKEIELYMNDRVQGVEVLSSFSVIQYRDMKEMAVTIQEYFGHVKSKHIKSISVYDEKGTIICSTAKDAIGLNYAECDFFQWAKKKENKGKQFVSSLIRAAGNQTERIPYFRFVIAAPVYQEKENPRYPNPTHKFFGIVTATVDLEEVLAAYLPLVSHNAAKEHVWILDSVGTVLFQSEHPEMVMKNIHQQDETCTHCHISFEHVGTILRQRQGTTEYTLKERPTKLASFSSIEFKNISWKIVLNIPFEEVSGFVNKNLMLTFILIGIITITLISASLFIYRGNSLKIRAQEEAKQWKEKRELEDRIRESEEQYRTMVETAHDVVWTLDAQGNVTYINKRGEEISGYKISDLIGKKYSLKVLEDDLSKVQDAVIQTLQGNPQSFEARIYNSDGKILFLSVNQMPLYQSGNVVGTVSFGRDITRQKQAEAMLKQERKKLVDVTQNTNSGLLLLDIQYRLTFANRIAEEWFGPFDEIEGKFCWEIFHITDLENQCAALKTVHTGETAHSEFLTKVVGGENKFFYCVASPIRDSDGNIQQIAEVVMDITERKRAEEELNRSNQELSVLHSIDRVVNETLYLDQILNVAIDKTIEVLHADAGGIYLLQEDGKTMRFVVHRGLSDEFVKNVETIQLGEGISGRAAAERKPVIMDIAQYPSSRLAPFIVKEGVQSMVSVPLLAKDRVLGAINVGSRKPDAFPADKIDTLLSIGIQIGVAVHNAELYKAEQRMTAQLLAINKIGQNIAAFMDVEELFSRVVKLIHETFDYAYVTLVNVDEKANEIVFKAAQGYNIADLKKINEKLGGEGIIQWVALSGKPLLTNDVSKESRFLYCDVLKESRSELTVPIMLRNKVVAVLDIQSDKQNAFNPDDLSTFETVARDISVAIENARLYEDLRGTTNYLENLITYANAPIIVWNLERKITIFNDAFEKLSGYRNDEVIGCDLEMLFPVAEKEDILKTIDETIKGERWETVEIPIQRKDGERRIALWNSASIIDKNGNIISTIAQGQDITERKLAEESLQATENRFRALIEKSSDVVSLLDSNGIIMYESPAAMNILGYAVDELKGRNVFELVHPEDLQDTSALFTQIIQEPGACIKVQFRFRHKDGSWRYLDAIGTNMLLDPNIHAVIVNYRDITDRVLAEKEISMLAHSLRSINECVSITDTENKILFINQSFLNVYGYSEDELIGKHISIIRSPKNLPELVGEILPATLRGGWHGELWNKRKNGTEFPIYLSTKIINDKDGKPLGLIGVAKDITERKLAEEALRSSESQLRKNLLFQERMITSLPTISFITTDMNAIVTSFSKGAENIFGYQAEEMIGQPVAKLHLPEDVAKFPQIIQAQIEGRIGYEGEMTLVRKNGELFPAQFITSPIQDEQGNVVSLLGVSQDITERKRNEQELILAKERAERSDKLKDAFIANISHEIRTPLNIILGYTGIIEEKFASQASKDEQIFFSSVKSGADRLMRTVELVLNVSRVQAGDVILKLETIQVPAFIENLLNDLIPLAQKRSLDLSFINDFGHLTVKADAYCLSQALINLIDNAIKYTKKGSITVRLYHGNPPKEWITSLREKKNDVYLDITDTGIGISKKYLEDIFKPYSQEEFGYTRSYEGIGLGLTLVKQYLSLHNVPITVTSRKGFGSTFSIRLTNIVLPNYLPESTDIISWESSKSPSDIPSGNDKLQSTPISRIDESSTLLKSEGSFRPVVLVAEDDLPTQEYMQLVLSKKFEVVITDSVEGAWNIIRSRRIDLILLDISLQGPKNGLDFVKELRKAEHYSQLPVIAVTAHAFPVDRINSLDAGCNGYIAKPMSRTKLFEIMEQLLAEREKKM